MLAICSRAMREDKEKQNNGIRIRKRASRLHSKGLQRIK